jgi:hypothetical protein
VVIKQLAYQIEFLEFLGYLDRWSEIEGREKRLVELFRYTKYPFGYRKAA